MCVCMGARNASDAGSCEFNLGCSCKSGNESVQASGCQSRAQTEKPFWCAANAFSPCANSTCFFLLSGQASALWGVLRHHYHHLHRRHPTHLLHSSARLPACFECVNNKFAVHLKLPRQRQRKRRRPIASRWRASTLICLKWGGTSSRRWGVDVSEEGLEAANKSWGCCNDRYDSPVTLATGGHAILFPRADRILISSQRRDSLTLTLVLWAESWLVTYLSDLLGVSTL